MKLATESYRAQQRGWPSEGSHILAHFDAETIVVYQAYRRPIADYALGHGFFGGSDFSYGRMSWIKPNFLWMMYRCGWGTKVDQEAVLGLRLRRTFFEQLLSQAVFSAFQPRYGTTDAWQKAVATSEVRLQWDPDHAPNGAKLQRRALQLGLRGKVLEAFGKQEILEVIDLSDFVESQRPLATSGADFQMPLERIYLPGSASVAANILLDE